MKIQNRKKQKGFTLVELVVVIILLGILAAVALPKFMDVTTQAHKAAVDGAVGGLGAGVALFHAQWVANGNTGAATDVTGFGGSDVDANAAGWPVSAASDVAALSTTTHCEEVWNGVMQNPPVLGSDYTVGVSGTTCTYSYAGDTGTARSISYASATGVVSKVNP